MEVEEIKKVISVRPFKPFEIHLDNCDIYKVTHPEIIISRSLVMTIDENGDSVRNAPEAINSITRLGSATSLN